MGSYGEVWGVWAGIGRHAELWGAMRRYREIWRDMGSYGEAWGLMTVRRTVGHELDWLRRRFTSVPPNLLGGSNLFSALGSAAHEKCGCWLNGLDGCSVGYLRARKRIACQRCIRHETWIQGVWMDRGWRGGQGK